MQLYKAIATAVDSRARCAARGNSKWEQRWVTRLEYIENNLLPSGSGIDAGTDIERPDNFKGTIKLYVAFHHMNNAGMYDGWTDHVVTIKPSLLSDFDLTISGRNRKDIKSYLADLFSEILREDVYILPGELDTKQQRAMALPAI